MVVTHFFLLLVLVSRMTSFLAFFLTLPPGSFFSMTSPCLSFSVRSATAPAAPPSWAAFHLNDHAAAPAKHQTRHGRLSHALWRPNGS